MGIRTRRIARQVRNADRLGTRNIWEEVVVLVMAANGMRGMAAQKIPLRVARPVRC
jgi:hypothetical protein